MLLVHWISFQLPCQYDVRVFKMRVVDSQVNSSEQHGQANNKSSKETEVQRMFNWYLQLYNEMGLPARDWQMFENLAKSNQELVENELNVYAKNKEAHKNIEEKLKLAGRSPQNQTLEGKLKINLAAVACGGRKDQALNMIKSAVLFSQDAHLHLIVFSDNDTILDLAAKILELRWTTQALGWDFTYELHLDWFPANSAWKTMWATCSTQRLFFPTLLPHIDSVIYLDSDIVVVSNLSDLWSQFNFMGSSKLAGMAANSENTTIGWYDSQSNVPFYGERGLNAGVMLMNLTQMREFRLEERALGIYNYLKEKISLADQDILNILFNGFPEKVMMLPCSYNFYWIHCASGFSKCVDETGHSVCFCNAILKDGVKIIHGNYGTFEPNCSIQLFPKVYFAFEKFDLILEEGIEVFKGLQDGFRQQLNKTCGPLDAEMLYKNAITYLGLLR